MQPERTNLLCVWHSLMYWPGRQAHARARPLSARVRVFGPHLDTRQLRLLDLVPVQQHVLLLLLQYPMLRHEHMLGDVDEQLILLRGTGGQGMHEG